MQLGSRGQMELVVEREEEQVMLKIWKETVTPQP
jgi:hypothetical protein